MLQVRGFDWESSSIYKTVTFEEDKDTNLIPVLQNRVYKKEATINDLAVALKETFISSSNPDISLSNRITSSKNWSAPELSKLDQWPKPVTS